MTTPPSWRRYLRFWTRDPRADVDDEITFHLDQRVHDLIARGLPADEAARRAAREFGEVSAVRDACVTIDAAVHRRATVATQVDAALRDIRIAGRSLMRAPTFTVTAVLCAALGIGVTATIVSAANAILRRPLPYHEADRLIAVYGEKPERGYTRSNISWPDFVDWRDRNTTFASLGMWTWDTRTLMGNSDAERLEGATVTANLFPTLGVNPVIGRHFRPDEERLGAPGVVLLSNRIWRRAFAGDSSIVGRTIQLDSRPFTVVGVMPEHFNFPDRGDLWTPFVTDPSRERHGNRGYAGAIGRLKPGVTFEQARADLHRLSGIMEKENPNDNRGWRADPVTMRDDLVGDLRAPLRVFLVGVALVLLMVCANVANLMLARGALRSREMAVRSALGATRGRLASRLLLESLLIAAGGGLLGIGIAIWGTRLLRFGFPDGTPPFYVNLSVDGLTVGIIAGVTALTALAAGLIPAFSSSRIDIERSLRDGTRGSGDGAGRARMRKVLVVAEVALSVVLMIGATLMLRSYRALTSTELGFSEAGIASARITLPATYATRSQHLEFMQELTRRLEAIPGVTSVGSAQGIPFSGWDVQGGVDVEGAPAPARGQELVSHYQWVTADYFKTIGVPLVAGRWLTWADRDSVNPVILVNQTFARRAFSDGNAVGKRVRVAGDERWSTIVGVIQDYRHYRLPQPMGPASYFSYAAYPGRTQTFVVRTETGDAASLIPAMRSTVRQIDPAVALFRVQTFDEVVSRSLWRQRLQGNVVGIFALLALALASLGLYGVISYAVAQRTREIGVRMALGAGRSAVAGMVLRQTMMLVGLGALVGVAGALGTTRYLGSLLYSVKTLDPVSFVVVPAVLVLVALVAVWSPTRRAMQVDPLIAMRTE